MIAIGSDHGGYELKEEIKRYLEEKQIKYIDMGTQSSERTDFPVYAKKVAESVSKKESDLGILICKTGVGMSIAANKFKDVRCALCFNEEVAKLSKEHTNANIIAIPAAYTNISQAVQIIRNWLGSDFFEGRYSDRLQMIKEIENENMK